MSIQIILLTVNSVKEKHPINHGAFYSPRTANYVDAFDSKEDTNLFVTTSIIDYEAWSFLVCGAT
jgi:hypothetical protein